MGRWRTCEVVAALALISGAPAVAAERWYVAQSGHAIVIGDGGTRQVRLVARELEQLRSVFQSVLNLRVESGQPLLVIAAEDESSMRRLIPWYWERRGGKLPAGVFFDRDEKDWAIVQADLPQPTHVIFHEYAHLVTRLSLGPLPLWLSEGLAEFFGGTRIGDVAVEVGEVDPRQVTLLRGGLPLPVARLVAVGFGSAEYTEIGRAQGFYAESAVLTHYLLLGDEAKHRPELIEFLRLRETGVSDSEALDRAFWGSDLLDAELRQYVHRLLFPIIKFPATLVAEAIPARELRPAEAAAFLADFMLHTDQLKAARRYVDEALAAEPALGFAHLQKGSLLVAEGRRDEATAELAQARRLSPRDALTQYRFGALGRGAAADAAAREEALRTAIRLAPSFAPASGALAQLLLEEARSPDEALALATAAASLDPEAVAYRVTALDLEDRMGCGAEVERGEKELLRLVSTDHDVLEALVRHYELGGRHGEAEAVLRRVHGQSPRDLFVTAALGSFLEKYGRPEASEAVLRDGLALDPHSELLLNNLAYLNAERGVKLPEALELVEAALRIAPKSASHQDTKGWVLFRIGMVQEAEQWTRKSLDSGESPVVREHLGDILAKEHRRDEALAAWRAALANDNATDEQRESLRSKIAKAEASP